MNKFKPSSAPLVLQIFLPGAVFSSRSQEVVQTYTVVELPNLIPAYIRRNFTFQRRR